MPATESLACEILRNMSSIYIAIDGLAKAYGGESLATWEGGNRGYHPFFGSR